MFHHNVLNIIPQGHFQSQLVFRGHRQKLPHGTDNSREPCLQDTTYPLEIAGFL